MASRQDFPDPDLEGLQSLGTVIPASDFKNTASTFPDNTTALGEVQVTNGMGDGVQRPARRYYSIHTGSNRRNQTSNGAMENGREISGSSCDTATSYVVRSARYPPLYKRLKTPADARRALKAWKQERTQTVAAGEAPTSVPVCSASVSDPGSNGSPGPPTTGVYLSPNSPLTATDHATAIQDLPPQHMTFSEPMLRETKGGKCLYITCTLDKSYPNFDIECSYIYIDKSKTVGCSQTFLRLSMATIATKENCWLVFMEQKDYNDEVIRLTVGQAEYDRLDGGVSGPVKGLRKLSSDSAAPVEATMAKKLRIPEGFDLGGIWCRAAGFYELRIFVPAKDYRH